MVVSTDLLRCFHVFIALSYCKEEEVFFCLSARHFRLARQKLMVNVVFQRQEGHMNSNKMIPFIFWYITKIFFEQYETPIELTILKSFTNRLLGVVIQDLPRFLLFLMQIL